MNLTEKNNLGIKSSTIGNKKFVFRYDGWVLPEKTGRALASK